MRFHISIYFDFYICIKISKIRNIELLKTFFVMYTFCYLGKKIILKKTQHKTRKQIEFKSIPNQWQFHWYILCVETKIKKTKTI